MAKRQTLIDTFYPASKRQRVTGADDVGTVSLGSVSGTHVQKQVEECLAPAQELKATLDELGLNLVPRVLHTRLRTIAEAVESSAETVPGVALYLSGVGGAGKSTVLFCLAAQLWKRPGWLVVYIAALSGIVDSTPDTKGGILGSAKKMLLLQLRSQGFDPDQIVLTSGKSVSQCFAQEDTEGAVIEFLSSIRGCTHQGCPWHVLLALDQWNASFPAREDRLRGALTRILKQRPPYNLSVCSISASFEPLDDIGAFDDADAVEIREEVEPFSASEAVMLLNAYRIRRNIDDVPGEVVEDILYKTKCIGRPLRYAASCLGNPQGESKWTKG